MLFVQFLRPPNNTPPLLGLGVRLWGALRLSPGILLKAYRIIKGLNPKPLTLGAERTTLTKNSIVSWSKGKISGAYLAGRGFPKESRCSTV